MTSLINSLPEFGRQDMPLQAPMIDDGIERDLLGAILVASLTATSNAAFEEASHLKAEDFLSKPGRFVYRAMERLFERKILIDLSMVRQELKDAANEKAKPYEDVGEAYLQALMLVEGHNVPEYARAVAYQSLRHRGEILFQKTQRMMRNTNTPLSEMVETVLTDVQEWVDRVHLLTGHSSIGLKQAAKQFIKTLRFNLSTDTKTRGISSGYKALDDIILGWQRRNLIIVAGRASMGKTAIMLDFGLHAAKQKERVLLFTFEQPEEELTSRLMANEADVDGMALQSLALTEDDLRRLEEAALRLEKIYEQAAFTILPMSFPSMDEIHAALKSHQLIPGFDLVIVDYAGPTMIRNDNRKHDTRMHMSYVSATFKDFAKEFNVPFIVGAQLNRAAASAERPVKEHLAESGGIENAADKVLLLFRDDRMQPVNGIQPFEVIVDKHRNGRKGTAQLDYKGASTKFFDASSIRIPLDGE